MPNLMRTALATVIVTLVSFAAAASASAAGSFMPGTVYVADTGGNDIDVFDPTGAHLRTIAPIAAPLNVVLDAGGTRLFVTQSVYGTGVHVFGIDGADLGVYGQTADSVLLTSGIAFGHDDVLYVGDGAFGGYTGSVKSFDAGGTATGTFADGLNAPMDIAVDATGNVWETNANDFVDNQIREYATNGALIKSFGSGPLLQPTGLAFAP